MLKCFKSKIFAHVLLLGSICASILLETNTVLFAAGEMPSLAPTQQNIYQENEEATVNRKLLNQQSIPREIAERVGKTLHFQLGQSVEYDDNIFESPKNEAESDVVFISSAGISASIFKQRGSKLPDGFNLTIGYVMDYEVFINHSNLNGFDHEINIDLGTDSFLWGRRGRISISESLSPESFLNDSINNSTRTRNGERQRRITNDFEIRYDYPVTGKMDFSLPYHNTYTHYLDGENSNFNSMRHSVAPRLSHKFTPKTSIYEQGEVAWTNYKDSSQNSVDYSLRTGIHKQVNAKINFDLSAGVQFHNRESGDNTRTYIFDGNYSHIIQDPRTRFGFGVHRSIEDALSASSEQQVSRGIDESLRDQNPTIINNDADAYFDHFFTPRLGSHTRTGISYEEDQSGGSRNDWHYYFRTGLSYYIKRNLTLNFNYLFSVRNSNSNESDYTRNRFIASINYGFGGGAPLSLSSPVSVRDQNIRGIV